MATLLALKNDHADNINHIMPIEEGLLPKNLEQDGEHAVPAQHLQVGVALIHGAKVDPVYQEWGRAKTAEATMLLSQFCCNNSPEIISDQMTKEEGQKGQEGASMEKKDAKPTKSTPKKRGCPLFLTRM